MMKKQFYKKRQDGQVMMLTTVFFLIIGLVIISGISFTALKDTYNIRSLLSGKVSFYVAESGIEDTLYRLKNVMIVNSNSLMIDGNSSSVTLQNNANGTITVLSQASTSDFYKRIQANITTSGTNVAFHYGIQAGNGGFTLANSSSIIGNVFSTGVIYGTGNYIYGDVISAGQNGLIYGIHATGTAYSHTIGSSTANATAIDKNAYYKNITANTTVSGTKYPNSTDQGTTSLPISDDQIHTWENEALAGGIMSSSSCDTYSSSSNTCTISSDKTLGPKKIPFNLLVKSSQNTLTVSGALWVTGNIDTQTKPIIRMASNLGSQNVPIIADNPANSTTSSVVTIAQGTQFFGSGATSSYVFIISQNNSAETGGSNIAISMGQGSSALVIYASHGLISTTQSIDVNDITAYQISLAQSSTVTYDTGLINTIFSTGPTGSFSVLDWSEL